MAEVINVGHADRVIRIILGVVCLGLLAYHFLSDSFLPLYAVIIIVILIPYFLKTGITRSCPIMKAMDVSTAKRETEE